MTARSTITVLQNTYLKNVHRTTLPKLPPAPGFDGADAYAKQVQAWKAWLLYEKSDPLEIREDDAVLYRKRILYLYKNALMALRFWPEMWYEAAEWCYQSDLKEMKEEGDKFLKEGIKANPESCLLAFRWAAQVEARTDFEDGEAGVISKGKAVREPFNTVLDALYDLTNKAKKREEQTVARAKDVFAAQQAAEDAARGNSNNGSDDDDEEEARAAEKRQQEKQAALDAQLKGISNASNAEIHMLKRTLSYAWIALMRAMRRVQGKGAPGAAVGGFRGVFGEARKRGKLLSDAYVASALIEHHCYQDPAATKIFDRGMKLFPDDENFALEYIKHLVKLNDATSKSFVQHPHLLILTSRRCSRCVRDGSDAPHLQAGVRPPGQIPIHLFPRLRIAIRRAGPDHQTRAAHRCTLPRRSTTPALRIALRQLDLRSHGDPTRHLSSNPDAPRHA
jgi:cleavage stimulation factor subunit 3